MDAIASVGPPLGTKRVREEGDDDRLAIEREHMRKHGRPTLSHDRPGPHDSIIGDVSHLGRNYAQARYDSEDPSSLVSEPGSPRDLDLSSSEGSDDGDDDDMDDEMIDDAYSHSPKDTDRPGSLWRERTRSNGRSRKSNPFAIRLPRPDASRSRSLVQQHIRQRHPQENGPEMRDVPSPLDEDEVATPPSAAAADAAGSQLSMLSVSDMDMDPPASSSLTGMPADSTRQHLAMFPVDHASGHLTDGGIVRKQRQRSGAQSSGSASPAPTDPNGTRRGFSVGFRADCDKCRMRVPGHMNHFTA